MKQFSYVFLLCLFFTVEIESGVLLNTLKSTVREAKCGLHKLGNMIHEHRHRHDICNQEVQIQQEHNTIEGYENSRASPKIVPQSTSTVPDIDIRGSLGEDIVSSTSEQVLFAGTTPRGDGKRLINVGSNCPDGFRADATGTCREEY